MLKLTPRDIQNQEFKKVIRGYDPVEVDTYLEIISDEFELLIRQKKDLDEKVLKYEAELKNYKQIEGTLQDTLIEAKRSTAETQESFRREAEIKMKEAELSAQALTESAQHELRKLQDDIAFLKTKKESFVRRLREWVKVLELDDKEIAEIGYRERRRRKGSFSGEFLDRTAEKSAPDEKPDTEGRVERTGSSPEHALPPQQVQATSDKEQAQHDREHSERAADGAETSDDEIEFEPEESRNDSADESKNGISGGEPTGASEDTDQPRKFHNGFNLIDKIIDEEDSLSDKKDTNSESEENGQ